MSKPVLLYLSGEPGVGKSTLMRALTDQWQRVPILPTEAAPARDALYPELHAEEEMAVRAVELGRRRDSFSGTDALPSTVINAAEAYLRSGQAAQETSLLLAEGARLANRRFLGAAVESGWRVVLLTLEGADVAADRRAKRAAALGVPEQNASWVKGRRSAAANLSRAVFSLGVEAAFMDADLPTAEQAEAVRTLVPSLA